MTIENGSFKTIEGAKNSNSHWENSLTLKPTRHINGMATRGAQRQANSSNRTKPSLSITAIIFWSLPPWWVRTPNHSREGKVRTRYTLHLCLALCGHFRSLEQHRSFSVVYLTTCCGAVVRVWREEGRVKLLIQIYSSAIPKKKNSRALNLRFELITRTKLLWFPKYLPQLKVHKTYTLANGLFFLSLIPKRLYASSKARAKKILRC